MKTIRKSALSVVLMLGLAVRGYGQLGGAVGGGGMAAEPAAGAGPGGAAVFVRASIVSFDAVNKVIADLGIPVPDLKNMLETSLPFLGPGSVATDRPLGVVVLASDTIPMGSPQQMVAVIPAVAGKVTNDSFKEMGATPVEGMEGVVSLKGELNLKRTAGYVMMEAGGTAGMGIVNEGMFAGDYKQKDNLAAVSVNLAAFRKAAPEAYKTFIDQVKQGDMKPVDVAQAAGEEFGQQMVIDFINKLEKVTVALAADDKALHVRTWHAPVKAGEVKPAPRPVFPPGVFVQNHVVYPDAEWANWVPAIVDSIPATAFDKMSPEQVAKAKDVFKRASSMFVGGNAVSYAFGMKEGKGVFYLVNQLSNDVDVATEMKLLWAQIGELTKNMEDKATYKITSYPAGSVNVTRAEMGNVDLGNKESKLCIDAIQKDKVLYVTYSTDGGHYVEELAGMGMKGTTGTFCAGAVDLSAMVAAGSEGTGPFATMPANMVQEMKTAFAEQEISWTVQTAGAGNYMYADVAVPMVVAKEISKLVGGMFRTEVVPAGGGAPPMP